MTSTAAPSGVGGAKSILVGVRADVASGPIAGPIEQNELRIYRGVDHGSWPSTAKVAY